MPNNRHMMIFTGNANRPLAEKVAKHLKIPLGKAVVDHFSDGEIRVLLEENVRGRDTFIIQPTCVPTNDTLMELVIMADTLRRSSAAKVTAVIPYYGYARQDRRIRSARVPITAKVVADMLTGVGFSRVVTVDLHADQIQGFFKMPVDNIYSTPVMLEDIRQQKRENIVVVSPDVGGVVRARAIAKRLDNSDFAIIDKRRPGPNEAQVMHLIGDVAGRDCIIVDDIIDTAGTLCSAAKALKEHGANKVFAYCTHPVLSGKALDNLRDSAIDELVVTDTIPLSPEAEALSNIRQISLSAMLAETMRRISTEESVSEMFME